MLTHLSIRNVVLIDRLELAFETGLTALTGETGAGKSILLDALGLALGARADAGLVRAGQDKATVTATFDIATTHPAFSLLDAQDVEYEDGPLILRRSLSADGRSRAFINDAPVSVRLLGEVGELLVEIHGQHAERGLLDARSHRALLDEFGGHEKLLTKVSKTHQGWSVAKRDLAAAQAAFDEAVQDQEYLTHVVKELEQLDPQEGEEEQLASTRQTMMAAEKVGSDLDAAGQLLSGKGKGGGVDNNLAQALRAVERAAAKLPDGKLDALAGALDRAVSETMEARALLDVALHDLDYDQTSLDHTEERLFALRAAARKHHVDVDSLPRTLQQLRDKLDGIATADDRLADLNKLVKETFSAYQSACEALTKARRKAAGKLDKAVMNELGPLKLDKARFETLVDTVDVVEGGAQGCDHITFQIATNPGSAPGPLIKIASGGELARFILALKVALAAQGSASTLVFDEVDRGIGGATAAAVGDRLKKLSQQAQVLVVTHSPQVAALGTRHGRIEKTDKGKSTTTSVTLLDQDQRTEEIARMLAGATISDEARAAAAKLLNGA